VYLNVRGRRGRGRERSAILRQERSLWTAQWLLHSVQGGHWGFEAPPLYRHHLQLSLGLSSPSVSITGDSRMATLTTTGHRRVLQRLSLASFDGSNSETSFCTRAQLISPFTPALSRRLVESNAQTNFRFHVQGRGHKRATRFEQCWKKEKAMPS